MSTGGRVATRNIDDAAGARRTATCNSFVPGTAVLMADGTTEAIEDVEVGDLVWASDPETGEEGPREVTRLITGHGDKTLVDLDVDGASVTATGAHPIWVNDRGEWIDAEDVRPGDLLLDEDGITVVVDDDVDIREVADQTVHTSPSTISTPSTWSPAATPRSSRTTTTVRLREAVTRRLRRARQPRRPHGKARVRTRASTTGSMSTCPPVPGSTPVSPGCRGSSRRMPPRRRWDTMPVRGTKVSRWPNGGARIAPD